MKNKILNLLRWLRKLVWPVLADIKEQEVKIAQDEFVKLLTELQNRNNMKKV